jgi:chromate reductase
VSASPRFVVLDGSVAGAAGNTASALDRVSARLGGAGPVERVVLGAYEGTVDSLAARLEAADGLVVGTGCYWGSWGSPLQRFLELMTPHEGTGVFLGKPAAAVVTMDSTGGAEVAVRLVGALTCLGCLVPPFGWMALSRVGVELAELRPEAARDVWGAPDLDVLAGNVVLAASAPRRQWRAWDVERAGPVTGPFQTARVPPGIAPRYRAC